MAYFDQISETDCFKKELSQTVPGITFHLASRCRFIPYVWLLYSEMNKGETELRLHYTHSVVTVSGTQLHFLHEAVEHFQLRAVQEMPSLAMPNKFPDATVNRIEISENVAG